MLEWSCSFRHQFLKLKKFIFKHKNGGELMKKIKPEIGILTLFILGELITFGFILLLQFVNARKNLVGFIFALLAMHVGIVGFILSKHIFKTKVKIRKHYYVEYIMLACYLPFLALAIAKVNIDRTLKLSLIFALTGIVVVVSAINDYLLAKNYLTKKETTCLTNNSKVLEFATISTKHQASSQCQHY